MFCLKNYKQSCLRALNTDVLVAKSSFPYWILWKTSPYFALFTLHFRWILNQKCAVFEQLPAFPGVIFCKIHTQSHTKGYMRGHLNAHVRSDKTVDHRSRFTIKNQEFSHAFWGWSDVQQMESARVVKPDEVPIGHLTPAEFWSALTISLFSTTLNGWTDAFNSCFIMLCAATLCKVMGVIDRQRRVMCCRRHLYHHIFTWVLLIASWHRLKWDETVSLDNQNCMQSIYQQCSKFRRGRKIAKSDS